jgi:hypothetical protein
VVVVVGGSMCTVSVMVMACMVVVVVMVLLLLLLLGGGPEEEGSRVDSVHGRTRGKARVARLLRGSKRLHGLDVGALLGHSASAKRDKSNSDDAKLVADSKTPWYLPRASSRYSVQAWTRSQSP